MDSNDTCLVSFASKGREDYNKMLYRLMENASVKWPYDCMFFSLDGDKDEHAGYKINRGIPTPDAFPFVPHHQCPYQFKFACIQIAREKGYKKILWLDTSMLIEKNPMPLLEKSNKGVVAFDCLGHPLYKYISDAAVKNLEISEDCIAKIQQTWGGAVMFDFTRITAVAIFNEIVRQSQIGSFQEGKSNRSGFIAHRHDQAAMSVVFWKFGVELYPYGNIVCDIHNREPYEYGKDIYFVLK